MTSELELAGWRRELHALYAAARAEPDPRRAHDGWRAGRDRLFADHPQSPLGRDDPLRASGLPCWPYDPAWRFLAPLRPAADDAWIALPTGVRETTSLRRIGSVELPPPLAATLDVWWMEQYGGGIFLPVRDGTSGAESYGGGRYLLDTVKGADLGTVAGALVLDFNFLYHPSCRYDPAWQCPLAPAGNVTRTRISTGERLSGQQPFTGS